MLKRILNWTSIVFIGVFFIVYWKFNIPWLYNIPWWSWNILELSVFWPVTLFVYISPIAFFIGLPLIELFDKKDKQKYLTKSKK